MREKWFSCIDSGHCIEATRSPNHLAATIDIEANLLDSHGRRIRWHHWGHRTLVVTHFEFFQT
jgi:hypothetical protein